LGTVCAKPKLEDDQIPEFSIAYVSASAAGLGVTDVVARFGEIETDRPLDRAEA